ncbi:MAG: polyprenyl synthetase family protein [Lachnospiraceae bacterium]|nr:polyprenyl synthetase family protein [Lachnospiraceae bacterium]
MFDLNEKTGFVNTILESLLPVSKRQGSIEDAMRYSVLNGGKRLRPIMLIEAFRLFCADTETEKMIALPFAAAIEFIHSYSLVHDDLPAMDDDTYRRGQLTTHKKFGHAMGVLTGDALLNYAFETMSGAAVKVSGIRNVEIKAVLLDRCVRAISEISSQTGYLGMIYGQVRDCSEETDAAPDEVIKTDELKTSCLFEAALVAGAILGGADPEQIDRIKKAGYHIGIAFQLRDDILDETATFEELGKDIGSDEKNGKKTFLALMGREKTVSRLHTEMDKARETINDLPGEHGFFEDLCTMISSN